MLTEIISNQTSCLQILDISGNFFSSVQTEKLLSKIAECGVCSNLKELGLALFSANFDSDESVRKFADILAVAPILKECNISEQSGDREVSVEIEYATEGRKGAVVISDMRTE